MPKQEADVLSLHAHCALQALLDGRGWVNGVQSLTEVLILTSFVAEAGYGVISRQTWIDAEDALNAAFKTGRETGIWEIDFTELGCVGAVLAAHDAQLASAPLGVLASASERLERLKKGEPDRLPQKKRA
jgi:Cys-tRNA synthase (O-phospho-L-seryl-tRNA:Cys-tRNA synthase)